MSPEGVGAEGAEADHSLDGGRVGADKDAGEVVRVDRQDFQPQEPDDQSPLVVAEPGSGTGRTAGTKGRYSPRTWWDRRGETPGRR